jgi:class 3 adenylate cyclase
MVGVASRIESPNKEPATEILIADIVFQQIAGEVGADDEGGTFVKGREHPVRVYAVKRRKQGRPGGSSTPG